MHGEFTLNFTVRKQAAMETNPYPSRLPKCLPGGQQGAGAIDLACQVATLCVSPFPRQTSSGESLPPGGECFFRVIRMIEY